MNENLFRKSLAMLLALLGLLGLWPGTIMAEEEARDITESCLINGSGKIYKLFDDDYASFYEPSLNRKDGFVITLEAPEGESIGAIQLRFFDKAVPLKLEAADENGEWQSVSATEGKFLVDGFVPGGVRKCRILSYSPDHPKHREKYSLSELHIYSAGKLPASFQQWEEAGSKVDLMLIVAHPDDEVLWFGGLLPTYAGEYGKKVLVVCMTIPKNVRKQELLDCLWTCGVTIHPVFAGFIDVNSYETKDVYKQWGRNKPAAVICSLYRHYKPDVVCLHDKKGEYGHGAHKVAYQAGCHAAELAADERKWPESVKADGTWQVKKIYVHLYPENPIRMDWQKPLSRFGGMCAQDVAREGMKCHRSQLTKDHRGWSVLDGGEYDNAAFGLFLTTVGNDVACNDLFENIP